MSVILLDPQKSKKIFHVVDTPFYLKSKNYYFPEFYAAALVLKSALINKCDEISVEVEGMRPMKFSTKYVEEKVRKNFHLYKFSGLDKKYTFQERLLMQHEALVNGIYI